MTEAARDSRRSRRAASSRGGDGLIGEPLALDRAAGSAGGTSSAYTVAATARRAGWRTRVRQVAGVATLAGVRGSGRAANHRSAGYCSTVRCGGIAISPNPNVGREGRGRHCRQEHRRGPSHRAGPLEKYPAALRLWRIQLLTHADTLPVLGLGFHRLQETSGLSRRGVRKLESLKPAAEGDHSA